MLYILYTQWCTTGSTAGLVVSVLTLKHQGITVQLYFDGLTMKDKFLVQDK